MACAAVVKWVKIPPNIIEVISQVVRENIFRPGRTRTGRIVTINGISSNCCYIMRIMHPVLSDIVPSGSTDQVYTIKRSGIGTSRTTDIIAFRYGVGYVVQVQSG